MNEHMIKNNCQLDLTTENANGEKLTLVNEYMQKLDRMQKELDKKNIEFQNKSKQIGELQAKK